MQEVAGWSPPCAGRTRAPRRPLPARHGGVRLASARKGAATRAAAAASALLIGGTALAGCAQKAVAAASLQLGTAYVQVPSGGTTEAYLAIQNNGPADRLTSARTSVGGRVVFRAPVRAGGTVMRTVPDIGIPAGATVRLSPASFHMLITGAGPMRSGGQIMLTLVFAKGGAMSVVADVTNPATGGSSYFLN
jgi:copper(I)-binding protein